MSIINNSISDFIIAMLSSGKNIKRFRVVMNRLEAERYKSQSSRMAISRLENSGYIKRKEDFIILTKKGRKKYLQSYLFSYIESPFNKNSHKDFIISFDIPGPQRKIRDWLRNQLKIFGYKMIQQSLWQGPGPLPKEFLDRLKKLGVKDNIKIFKTNGNY
jgi:DNA-binding transcriptional regulator PaaX